MKKYVLTFDTSTLGVVRSTIFSIDKNKARRLATRHATALDHRHSSIVLQTIDSVIRAARITRSDLSSIMVVKGPGPFTAVRVGVVTANALGWALGIPVYGCRREDFENPPEAPFRKGGRKGGFRPVMPEYGAEPNITIGKRSVTSNQ